jgi:hypothetical protein
MGFGETFSTAKRNLETGIGRAGWGTHKLWNSSLSGVDLHVSCRDISKKERLRKSANRRTRKRGPETHFVLLEEIRREEEI